MILVGANLIGCAPYALALSPPTFSKCIDHINFSIRTFNEKRKPLVGYLNENFPNAKFTYLNAYAISHELLDNPSRYGFKVTTTACCGLGRKRGSIVCPRNQIPRKNRDEHCFWDSYHVTEAANLVIARKLLSDEAEFFTYPFTISQLARL
ncbi:GDSL esterase/lipase At4g18970-like [Rhodamnia argentea]|uniref:GDSL esterase/lipase At4g18970-like n=1 Tax=Rhodamnia argentea TaxID=178133 RepID=A0A8B8MRG5_9MYRT|nr:GDSL esterase/lipase At4g18970-like [Rhodamnia argentea]